MDQAVLVSPALTVLQVLPALAGGGVERGTLEVAAELVRRGQRSLVMSAGGRMVAQLREQGSEHYCWTIGRKSLLTLRLIPALRRFLSEQQVDIVHVRSRLPAWICYLAWRGMDPAHRPRLVTTAHGFYSVGYYSAVMTRGEAVIAVSDAVADYLRNSYASWQPSVLRVIPRGIDPSLYFPGFRPAPAWLRDWQAQFPQCANQRLVVLAGRITRLKGHHDFIQLIAALRQMHPDIHGLIVGEADAGHQSYLAELEAEVHAQGLGEAISFAGHRPDLREIFSISALVLSLSTQPEAFGRTVLEALALGIPVVAYARGGVAELLTAMYPLGAVAPGDRQGLFDASLTALGGEAKPASLPEKFHLQQMLDSTLATYREVLMSNTKGGELAFNR